MCLKYYYSTIGMILDVQCWYAVNLRKHQRRIPGICFWLIKPRSFFVVSPLLGRRSELEPRLLHVTLPAWLSHRSVANC